MENKMAEVAKLLGVELGEEFWLADCKMGYERIRCKYKITAEGLQRKYYFEGASWSSSTLLLDILTGRYEVVKKAISILDDAEKRYLSAVIKPFRSRVRWIRKYYLSCQEFIQICVFNDNESLDWMTFELPYFKRGTMYQGMKIDKRYTIQELGL